MNRAAFYEKELEADYQELLREPWCSFALRTGKCAAEVDEEHVKHCDETWEDYVVRKAEQEKWLREKSQRADAAERAEESKETRRQEISSKAVARVLAYEKAVAETRTPSRHWLFVDFDKYQQAIFERQRWALGKEEGLLRDSVLQWTSGFYDAFRLADAVGKQMAVQVQTEREAEELRKQQEEEAERERQQQEQKEREKQLKLEQERAEREHREQIELEKKLERKRREEEKRAKARAEREKAKQAAAGDAEPAVEASEENDV